MVTASRRRWRLGGERSESGRHRWDRAPWITGLTGEMVTAGVDESSARVQARLPLAVARGLLLDLLATGDREEVGQACERSLQIAGHDAPHPPPLQRRLLEGPAGQTVDAVLPKGPRAPHVDLAGRWRLGQARSAVVPSRVDTSLETVGGVSVLRPDVSAGACSSP